MGNINLTLELQTNKETQITASLIKHQLQDRRCIYNSRNCTLRQMTHRTNQYINYIPWLASACPMQMLVMCEHISILCPTIRDKKRTKMISLSQRHKETLTPCSAYCTQLRLWCRCRCFTSNKTDCILTLTPLTWKTWRAPNNASRWQTGFNSAFKGLIYIETF
jgi:hypothetical protein